MLEVVRYKEDHKTVWNAFVTSSKKGTFLFCRDYMEYHSDRFTDHSLLFFRKGKLIALLPANKVGATLESHGGLSYGGFITGISMKSGTMLQVFEVLKSYLKDAGFAGLKYKVVPFIYHKYPADEDLYALFKMGATLVSRDLNAVIDLKHPLPYSKLRKRMLKKIIGVGLILNRSYEFEKFMIMVAELLQSKYNLKPTHSIEELKQLAERFPEHIKLYCASKNGEMLAGILVYETATVAHCQYIGVTASGKESGALDALINNLLTIIYQHKQYFSFGISTEQQGKLLNENLLRNKESYGARAVVHDTYELKF